MLSKSTLGSVGALANQLAEKGVVLAPAAGSALEPLVSKSREYADVVDSIALESHDQFEEAIAEVTLEEKLMAGSTQKNALGEYEHDELQRDALDKIIRVVRQNLNVARNVVQPAVEELTKQVETQIQASVDKVLTPYEVVPFAYHELWNNQYLEQLVAPFVGITGGVQENPSTNLTTPAVVVDQMLTGVSLFDESIRSFADSIGEERLSSYWMAAFGPQNIRTFGEFGLPSWRNADFILVTFLLARRYYTERDESQSNVGLSNVVRETGRMVAEVIRRRGLNIKNQKLVLDAPRPGEFGKITVNADVYNPWLEQGGAPELVYSTQYYGVQESLTDTIANKERHIAAWNRVQAQLSNTRESKRTGAMIDALRKAFGDLIAALPSDWPNDTTQTNAALADALSRVDAKNLDCLYKTIRDIYCTVIYGHTDALKIIRLVDESAEKYPDLDIREAATIATCNYLGDWLSGNITSTRT